MTEITFRNAKLVAGQLIIDIPYEHRGAVMNFIRNMKNCLYQLEIKVFKKKRSNALTGIFGSWRGE